MMDFDRQKGMLSQNPTVVRAVSFFFSFGAITPVLSKADTLSG
jgi:hypothetical protein